MDPKNKRFREVREACKKTQEEWASIMGLSRSGITAIESGDRNVTDKHLKILESWKDRQINTDYIRTGNGSIFLEPEEDDLIAKTTKLLGGRDPGFEALVKAYSHLNENNRKVLVDFLIDFANCLEKKE